MGESYVLIIWQEIPESLKLYLVPSSKIDEEQMALLDKVNGKYVNSDDMCDELEFIQTILAEDHEYVYEKSPYKKWGCLWHEFKVEQQVGKMTDSFIKLVCSTGMYL